MPCSNAAKTRNPLKFAGVPQTTGWISAVSGPKFTILWGHVENISLLKSFFPIVDKCLSCEDIAWQSCAMVPRWRFLATFIMWHFLTVTPIVVLAVALLLRSTLKLLIDWLIDWHIGYQVVPTRRSDEDTSVSRDQSAVAGWTHMSWRHRGQSRHLPDDRT